MSRYQVALSFAGEQRGYVERVAKALQARGVAVFYDRFEQVELWGRDGIEAFHQIFSAETAAVAMFISKEYVEKPWTRHERRSAFSKAIQEVGESVLPVRFDDTPVPGLPSSIQYDRAADHEPEVLASMIAEKLRVPKFSGKASDVPAPQFSALSGEVTFDYTAYDGKIDLGDGSLLFETMWTKSSDGSIHTYNDRSSINGIAVARGSQNIEDIGDASSYDFSSRARTPHVGEIVVMRNTEGFYAAVQVVDVKYERRNADRNEATIRYAIQPDGSASFRNLGIEIENPDAEAAR